jgi:hypothetical protein
MTESKPPRGESPPPAPQSWGESAPQPPILGERGERVVWGGHPPVPPAGERPCAPGGEGRAGIPLVGERPCSPDGYKCHRQSSVVGNAYCADRRSLTSDTDC